MTLTAPLIHVTAATVLSCRTMALRTSKESDRLVNTFGAVSQCRKRQL